MSNTDKWMKIRRATSEEARLREERIARENGRLTIEQRLSAAEERAERLAYALRAVCQMLEDEHYPTKAEHLAACQLMHAALNAEPQDKP